MEPSNLYCELKNKLEFNTIFIKLWDSNIYYCIAGLTFFLLTGKIEGLNMRNGFLLSIRFGWVCYSSQRVFWEFKRKYKALINVLFMWLELATV